MASEHHARTNQKLFFASLYLQHWRDVEQADALNVLALCQAHRESTLFHLYGAMASLCHEVADFYRLPAQGLPNVERFLARESAPNPELGELLELYRQPQSWLRQLLDAQARQGLPQQAVVPSSAIGVVDVDATQPVELDRTTLSAWREQLQAMALRFRQGMLEC